MDEPPKKPKKKYRPFWRPRHRSKRSTPAGEHKPVMLAEVLAALDPKPGQTLVDCTLGFAGHAVEVLRALGPAGRLVACDLDPGNLEPARLKLEGIGHPFSLHHANFAGVANVLAAEGVAVADGLLADLGMSSMQVDDPERGFSYRRSGPLDMRMDRSRGKTAAELLNDLSEIELTAAFRDLGDEPQAQAIAGAIAEARQAKPIELTGQLRQLIQTAAPVRVVRGPSSPPEKKQLLLPTARVFQALRILVNRELASLSQLLRVLPDILAPGGTAVLIGFHSGEDRLVKNAFREGIRAGVYEAASDDPVRPSEQERRENPRSRSAKLRWARRASASPSGEGEIR